jgi:hypothetical protein
MSSTKPNEKRKHFFVSHRKDRVAASFLRAASTIPSRLKLQRRCSVFGRNERINEVFIAPLHAIVSRQKASAAVRRLFGQRAEAGFGNVLHTIAK